MSKEDFPADLPESTASALHDVLQGLETVTMMATVAEEATGMTFNAMPALLSLSRYGQRLIQDAAVGQAAA